MKKSHSQLKLQQVMIVDDDPFERDLLLELLSGPNRSIETFDSGKSALEFARHHAVDLALLDHVMPGMLGSEVARHLKRLQPQARVVMCTGYLVDAGAEMCPQIDQVFHKPLPLGQILDMANADASR